MATEDQARGGWSGRIPTGPGVYFLRDAEDRLVYVGKASSLRRRLADHARTRRWEAIESVAWELAGTPSAAEAREADLLAGLQPPWNKVADGFFSFVTVTPSGLQLGREGAHGCFPHLGRGSVLRPSGDCIDGFDATNRIVKLCRPDISVIDLFLSGGSDRLLEEPAESDQPHIQLGLSKDRELARRFYRAGPLAMARLRRVHGVRGSVSREMFTQWMRTGAEEASAATRTPVGRGSRL